MSCTVFLKYVLRNSPEVGSYLYVSTTMNIIAFLMIVRIQNSIPQVKVTSSIYNCKFLVQHPKDQSVDQRNHLPGQYIYFPGCREIYEILPCTGLLSAHAEWYMYKL